MRANPLSGRRSRRDRAQLIDPVGDALRGFAKLLDAPVRCVTSGEPVALTATEYELLRVLATDAGRVLSYDTLLRRVWGPRNGEDAHLVRIFVKTLRKKLGEDAAKPQWIFNERGVGYRMAEPGAD